MNRLLITGASGFLGGHLCELAKSHWQVIGSYYQNNIIPDYIQAIPFNLIDPQSIERTLNRMRPDAVIQAAVLQVDACERNPQFGQAINIDSSQIIAKWCYENSSRFIYISSDLVFDGEKGMYSEEDKAVPKMLYGKNKLDAEKAVMNSHSGACLVRLPFMYGNPVYGGSHFLTGLLENLEHDKAVNVFHDQYRTPGLVDNMAEAILEIALHNFSGLIHICGTSRCSREEFARCVCQLFEYDENLLNSISMFDIELPALRPRDVSLNSTLARGLLKTRLLGYREGLKKLLAKHNL